MRMHFNNRMRRAVAANELVLLTMGSAAIPIIS